MTDTSPSAFQLPPSDSPFAFRPSPLPSDLRNILERVVIEARDAAEAGARAALEGLAVHHHEPYPHMKPAQRALRNHLRARARQLGDRQNKTGKLTIDHLVNECAYEHWHRMLFARFLAENNLLIEPETGVPITLDEAEELAEEERRKEQGERREDSDADSALRLSPSAFNKWVFASRCAQRMLPQIFRPDLPAPRPNSGQFCVYVLKCSDGSFYIGQTDDFPRRLSEHEKGEVSWTAPRLPVEPIHWEVFPSREKAVKREKDLKTGFGRKWLKREYNRGGLAAAARQAGDPLLQVAFATEHMLKLEKLLASLPAAVFTASDALGWVYQFWQSKKKDEVNRSEVKIGADELPAVTQLFTEPYMVEFLLHNTLGAWWAGKKLKDEGGRLKAEWEKCQTEDDCRRMLALPGVSWDYLRFVKIEDLAKASEKGDKDTPPSAFRLPPSDSAFRLPPSDSAFRLPPSSFRLPPSDSAFRLPPSVSAFRLSPSAFFPAAGTFDGWPKAAAEIKVLDPCCGSGHFLVAALHHLVPIRQALEDLSAAEAVDAVLRDNLHGLEIDERCCQIAAFALALAAWTYPDAGGPACAAPGAAGRYRPLPELHIACSGTGPQCSEEEWVKLAEKFDPSAFRLSPSAFALKNGLLNLHQLFSQAPTLGSLIDPAELPGDLIAADYETIQPYLATILKAEKADDETRERAIAAAGMVKAADLLARHYTLVATNVPYLARGKQDPVILQYGDAHHADTKWELATMFIDRCLSALAENGTACIVSPQNWLFSARFDAFRQRLLKHTRLNVIARLGAGAFGAITGEVVKVTLGVFSPLGRAEGDGMAMLDVLVQPTPDGKASALKNVPFIHGSGEQQSKNPNARILLAEADFLSGDLLEECADCYQGLVTGDAERFIRGLSEVPSLGGGWVPYMTAPYSGAAYEGRASVLKWDGGAGDLADYAAATRDKLHDMHESGQRNWGKLGVAIGRVTRKVMVYTGEHFDNSVATIVPKDSRLVLPLYCFASSPEFIEKLHVLDQKLSLTNRTILKVDFDIARWQKAATKEYPDGLPEPESDDPTQWLFHGRPDEAQEGTELQVAVARLLGYRWPAEMEGGRRKDEGGSEEGGMRLSKRARELVKRCDELLPFADNDGIVCISSVRGEEPAAEQLRWLLAAAFGEQWSAEKEQQLIRATGSTAADLDDWLRNDFFEQHCKLFHDRPFIWHIWDGRKRDGFHALVNYHKLCGKDEGGRRKAEGHAGRRLLESLTYAYLGEWITRQKDGVKRGEGGAEDRLAAAVELQNLLKAIIEGEPPFDIFVRWKKLSEQPIGWEPDINDGVRMNIRPFLASDLPAGKKGAGILRCKPNIKWTKDRGKEPERPKTEYPWFWGWDGKTVDFIGGKAFDGNRLNACHYTTKAKQAARDAAGKDER